MGATVAESQQRPKDPVGSAGTGGRMAALGLSGVLAVHALLCWLARPPGFLVGQDDVEYAVLGQSLRHGGYNLFFRADNPIHAQYPPGYPAMLGVWGAVFGDHFDALVLVSVLSSVAFIGITWLGVRRIAGPFLALAVAAVLAVNPALVGVGSTIASEAPYAFLSVLVVYILMSERRSAGMTVLACSLAILAALTRSIGIVLVLAVATTLTLERRWKSLALFAVAATIFVGGWMLWTVIAPEHYLGMSYIADLRASVGNGHVTARMLRRRLGSVIYYTEQGIPWALAVPSISGTVIDNYVAASVLYTSLVAGFIVFVRRWRAAAIYLVFYFGLLAVWLYHFDRLVTPAVPLLMGAIFIGWDRLLRRASIGARGVAIGVLAVLMVVGAARRTSAALTAALPCRAIDGWPPPKCLPDTTRGFFEALRYIRNNLPEDALFLTAKSGALWEYTGRKSVSYGGALAQDTATFVPFLRSSGARWVLLADLEQSESRRLLVRLDHVCRDLSVEASFLPRTYLLRLDDTGDSDEGCAALRAFRERLPRNREPDRGQP